MHWLVPWGSSLFVVIVTGATVIFYTLGSIRNHTPWLRQCFFWLGLVLMYAMLHTHYDYYSGHGFWTHCFQHIILHHDAPFFIAFSMPGMTLFSGTPASWRKYIVMGMNYRPLRQTAEMLNRPAVAVFLFCALNIFWMIPSVHFFAMPDGLLYHIMNWSMIINGLMFWNVVLNSKKLQASKRIGMMLAIIPPQIVLGMLIFATPELIYTAYGICGRAIPGISPLLDQQIGGFILWVPAAMMSVIGVLIVIRREWFRPAVHEPVFSANA